MEDGAQASLTTRSMRARNRRQLLQLLRENGALSQAQIARKTGLSRTTVSTLVAELRGLGVLVESDSERPGAGAQGGRPPVMLALDDSAGAAVGVDIGHGHVRVAVANLASSAPRASPAMRLKTARLPWAPASPKAMMMPFT